MSHVTPQPIPRPRPVMAAFRWVVAMNMVVGPLVNLFLAFGTVDLSVEQIASVNTTSAVVVSAVAYALGLRSEGKVTPVFDPRDDTGVALVPAQIEPIV